MTRHQHVAYLSHAGDTPRELFRLRWFRLLVVAAVSTLSMGCMGSAVLPLAGAFSEAGIGIGLATVVALCAANVYTSRLLLRQARHCGAHDYETLGYAVKGAWWRTFVELSNWLLLFGTIMGSIIQLGETGVSAIRTVWCEPAEWLVGPIVGDKYYGRVLTILYMLVLVMPWSLLNEMKELEYAGMLGYPLVLWLVIALIVRCVQQGFPAIRDGSFGLGYDGAGGEAGLRKIAMSISTWAFAFYIQPLLMPLYSEMPPGNVGTVAAGWSATAVLCGTALVPYLLLAFFGAALFGHAASDTGNLLNNNIFGDRSSTDISCPNTAHGALAIAMSIYLAITIPPIEFSLRHVVNTWVSELKRKFRCLRWIPKRNKGRGGWLRNVCISLLNLTAATLLALSFPSNSSLSLTITGASGVLLVSFVIPVVNHYILLCGKADCQRTALVQKKLDALQPDGSMRGLDEEAAAGAATAADAAVRLDHAATRDTDADSLADVRGVRAPSKDVLDIGLDGLAAANMIVDSADPSSYTYNAPVTNAFYAHRFADPHGYRRPSCSRWRFWAVEIVLPAAVLACGLFASICTLMGVPDELAAAAGAR